MGFELLILLGAVGLGSWAVLSEPAREFHDEWAADRERARVAAEEAARAAQLSEIDNSIALLTLQILDPQTHPSIRIQAEHRADALELDRRQLLAVDLPSHGPLM